MVACTLREWNLLHSSLSILKLFCEVSSWLYKMEIEVLNAYVSLFAAALMMVDIVYVLIYITGSYSSRSGSMSMRVVLLSSLYFFGSAILIFLGVDWLTQVALSRAEGGASFFLNIGASAFALAGFLNILCGFITVFLYVRGQVSLGRSLRRVGRGLRIRPKSRHAGSSIRKVKFQWHNRFWKGEAKAVLPRGRFGRRVKGPLRTSLNQECTYASAGTWLCAE